jgi:hypothetical protein
MISTSTQTLTQPGTAQKGRKTVLLVNGLFLALVGGLFMVFDLVSFYWGVGPLGAMLHGVLYTIGFVEAHGLALIIGLLMLRAWRTEPLAIWHLVGASVHLLLGGANLLFWQLVIALDVVALEIVVTAIHGLLFAAQLYWFLRIHAENR